MFDLEKYLYRCQDWERGDMEDAETEKFFQEMIDEGVIWELSKEYQSMADALLVNGKCSPHLNS
jgi:hypothetical protein